MLSRFCIFSSKLFKNAGFLSIGLVLLIESQRQRPLFERYASHEVDIRLQQLDKDFPSPPVLLLSDSVGRDWFEAFQEAPSGRFADFSSNQAIEMTGQLFLLQRYLDKHPPPGVIALMAGRPFAGDLHQVFTENFVLRVFTQPREIAWISRHTLNPAITLKSISYRMSPSFKYRLQLQEAILGASQLDAYSGQRRGASLKPLERPPYSLNTALQHAWHRQRNQKASHKSWDQLLTLCDTHDIRLVFMPPPTRAGGESQTKHALNDVRAFLDQSDQLAVWEETGRIYPDDWFWDGTHLSAKGLEGIQPLQRIIAEKLLRKAVRHEQVRQPGTAAVDRLDLMQELGLNPRVDLKDFYPVEWHHNVPFAWSKGSFSLTCTQPVSSLTLYLSPVNQPTEMTLTIEGNATTYQLPAGAFSLTVPLPDSSTFPLTVDAAVPVWKPDAGDSRSLGIALEAVGTDPVVAFTAPIDN